MPETSSWFTQWFWIHLGIGEDLSNLLDLHQFFEGMNIQTSKHPQWNTPPAPVCRSCQGMKLMIGVVTNMVPNSWAEGKPNSVLQSFSGFARLKAMVLVNCYFFLGNEFTIGMLAWIWQEKGSWDFNSQSLQSPPNLEASLDAVPHFLILTSISSCCIILHYILRSCTPKPSMFIGFSMKWTWATPIPTIPSSPTIPSVSVNSWQPQPATNLTTWPDRQWPCHRSSTPHHPECHGCHAGCRTIILP